MTRITRRILAAALLLAVASASADEQLAAVQAVVSEKFPEIRAENVYESPVDGWYMIRKGAIVAYVSADGRFLLQGDLIDLEAQVNLSEESRNQSRREMMAAYPQDEMIVFKPAETKHTIAVFTDIDCTFCRRLHSQIDEYLAEGIEIHYLLYPRNGPTSTSWAKAEQVWCSDDRNEALTRAKLDKDFETHDCDPSVVGRHFAMGKNVGLTGTPALVLEDGTLISGYLPPAQLSRALEAGGS